MKVEVAKRDQGMIGACSQEFFGRKNAKAFARDFQPAPYRNVQFVEFDSAVKACLESFEDSALEDGSGAMKHHIADDEQDDRGAQN